MKVFDHPEMKGHEQVVFCHDKATGLKAIIAIHSTHRGPSLGGCRLWNYASEAEALTDVLRLSRGMTYKSAVSGLPLGGGKAVIIGDPATIKSPALFQSFGRFVDSLNGRYITAEDVNIKVADMEHIIEETTYYSGSTQGGGDPSPVTAYGVYWGMKAAAKHKFGSESLKGLKVAVQGCGAVGSFLCELLAEEGAQLAVADIDQGKVDEMVNRYQAEAVALDKIHSHDCDIFAPCALGGILNPETIPALKAKIVAGGANNQLLDENRDAELITQRGILYAPDYAINAGGVINCYQELVGYDKEEAYKRAKTIYDTIARICQIAEEEQITTREAADRLAEQRLAEPLDDANRLRQSLKDQAWFKRS